jgi:RNA polymerase subunit RPABC4/transcription elongation factor Spt4
MVIAAAKLGKTSKKCDSCGKSTPIDALACPHCGSSPKTMFMAGQ